MARDPRLTVPLSGMGGIYTWIDAAEYILLGATTLQVTTAILQHGYRIVEDMAEGLLDYLIDHGHTSPHDIIGRALPNVTDPDGLSHANQVVSEVHPELCIGCGQCYLTCRDGAAQAISMTADRKAVVDQDACFGCLMCRHICPVEGAITYRTVPHHGPPGC